MKVTQLSKVRDLRKTSTFAEHLLWNQLRNRRFEGIKFRRQHPVGNYILDFVSIDKHLVIEVDGGQHNKDRDKIYDQKRTEFLVKHGFRVIRFWNNEVITNIEGVLEIIKQNL